MFIVEELNGDTLTPISIFQRLQGKKKFLLESSLKHENSGRFSFIGVNPSYEIKGIGETTQVISQNDLQNLNCLPLEALKKLVPTHESNLLDLPFIGGAVGFVGYDVVRYYENIGAIPFDELGIPDVHFMIFEIVIVYDHLLQKVYIIGTTLEETTTETELRTRLSKIKLEIQTKYEDTQQSVEISSYTASMTKDDFISKVKKAKEYIIEGDIFQVVLSQRMKASISGDPFSFYRKLRVQNPSPYMYYLDFDDYIIAGASPESLIKASQQTVITNPIAGTRPRGKTNIEDQAYEVELLNDEKELAEHRMLVDLGRNDLGKVCKFGSIELSKYMKIEKYKHVMHLVSEVIGTLDEAISPIDALISCLPAGTVSGAPKIRAMEIINELEEVKRGIYSGAVGYYSVNGNMDFALAIRTMVIKEETAYIQAGAGIVYDSIPEKEYEETLTKLKTYLEDQIHDLVTR